MSDKTRKAIAARLERLRAVQKPAPKTAPKATVSSKPEKETGEPQGQS